MPFGTQYSSKRTSMRASEYYTHSRLLLRRPTPGCTSTNNGVPAFTSSCSICTAPQIRASSVAQCAEMPVYDTTVHSSGHILECRACGSSYWLLVSQQSCCTRKRGIDSGGIEQVGSYSCSLNSAAPSEPFFVRHMVDHPASNATQVCHLCRMLKAASSEFRLVDRKQNASCLMALLQA